MKLQKGSASIFDRVVNYLSYFAGGLIAFICLSVCLDVFLRYFFGGATKWVIGVTEVCLLFICFLGTAWLLREEGHVKVDIVLIRLNPRNRALVNIATSILGAMLCLVLLWYSIRTSLEAHQLGSYIFGTIDRPLLPMHVVIAVGSFFLFVQFLRRAYGYWRASQAKR